MLLEAYRECLRDVFDMPALLESVARGGDAGDSRACDGLAYAVAVCGRAAVQLCGELHLRRRCAAGGAAGAGAQSIDQDQLRELMGDADLRELLDLGAIEEVEETLQCVVDGYKARNADGCMICCCGLVI